MCSPRALARLLPSAVRVRIRSRSTSARPPSTASIKRPVRVPVSAHGSASDRNCAFASTMRFAKPRRSRANSRPPSRSACVIDRLRKNRNPLGNVIIFDHPRRTWSWADVRRTAPQFCGRKFHGHGSHWLFRSLVFGSGIRRLDGEAVGGRHHARTSPRRVTRWLAASTIAPPGSSALFNPG